MDIPHLNQKSFVTGHCPNVKCRAQLFFAATEISIKCTDCGQRYEKHAIHDAKEANESTFTFYKWMRLLCTNSAPKKEVGMVKVLDRSSYHYQILSPLLTYYGMDNETGKAKLLAELNKTDMFDCELLIDKSFRIDRQFVEVPGYGRDISGSMVYLGDTLQMISSYNNGEERLIPIHTDADGNSLFHAISRALVGRDLLWHPLTCNLKAHFQTNLDKYKVLCEDFINASEWPLIIEECDPACSKQGLSKIHLFGLANILKRPILLLDSLSGMQTSGDYSALFLPGLISVEECRKNGELNKAICLAWSNKERNHYIPLVGISQCELPLYHRSKLPKVWVVSQQLVNVYLEFDSEGCIVIGGRKCLRDTYIQKLAEAIDEVYYDNFAVHPALVAEVHYYLTKIGSVGVGSESSLVTTQKAIKESRLYRCLNCDALNINRVFPEFLRPGGLFYSQATKQYGALEDNRTYALNLFDTAVMYNKKDDILIPVNSNVRDYCKVCYSFQLRQVRPNGSIVYLNGDRIWTPSKYTSCESCHKHYWDGKEYDNNPQKISVILKIEGKEVIDEVNWFQHEVDQKMNSSVCEVASSLIFKHFPDESGNQHLMQSVVEQIIKATKSLEEKGSTQIPKNILNIFITDPKILHKEELDVSKTEPVVPPQLEKGANEQQRKPPAEERKKVSKKRNETKGTDDDSSVEDPIIHQAKKISIGVKRDQDLQHTNNPNEILTSEGRQHAEQIHTIANQVSDTECMDVDGIEDSEKNKRFEPDLSKNLDEHDQALIVNEAIDVDYKVLVLAAFLSNCSISECVQNHPEFFSHGGLFLRKAAEQGPLVDGGCYQFPVLAENKYKYNKDKDMLELFVEQPRGHFPAGNIGEEMQEAQAENMDEI